MTCNVGNQIALIQSVSSLALPVDFQVLKKTSTAILGETLKRNMLLLYLKLRLVHLASLVQKQGNIDTDISVRSEYLKFILIYVPTP
jgi:hypothetical protein